jgi:MmyB-like transcription regulator ligand binding domain
MVVPASAKAPVALAAGTTTMVAAGVKHGGVGAAHSECAAPITVGGSGSFGLRAKRTCLVAIPLSDENFHQWLASHQVAHKTFGTKQYRHAVAGDLTLDWQILSCADDPDQFLLIMTAEPGSTSHQGLRFLASWATTRPDAAMGREPMDREKGLRPR